MPDPVNQPDINSMDPSAFEEPIALSVSEAQVVEQSRQNARVYFARRIKRCVDNWAHYWALDPELGLGQWPADVVSSMLAQRRQLSQYNLCKVIIDTLAGGIMQVPFDPEFYPVDEEITSLTDAIKKSMYSDKELMSWDAAYFQLVRDGLVHEACVKMYISREYDKLGNIGLKNCLSGTVLPDPNWKTNDGNDCQVCWMDTWHTARNLIEKYPEKAALIRWQLQRPRDPDEYQPAVGPTPYVQEESALLGSVHRLTQEYRMITKTLKEEWVKVDGVGDVKIPDMPDINKPQWLNENYPGWNPESVYIKTSRKRLCVVRAICPSIAPNDLLENGLCEIQIGRLPFFWWAPDRAGGEISCPMDSIKDSQENINYWMSLMTYKLQVDGGGGSQLADPSKFATRGVYDDYVQNRNDPTKIFEVKPGALDSGHGPTESTTKGQFPSEAITLVQMIFSVFLPHISKVTPSTRGIKESSGTSGKLYEAMREQSELGSFTTHYSLRLYWAEIYDAYFMLATELYSNNGVERTFSFNKGRESITLNKRVQLEDGSEGIENDVSRLKSIRHKVIISETQQSPTQKIASIKMLGELAKELGQSSPLISKYLANKICALTPSMDQEDRESIKVLGTVDIELQIQEAKTKMSGLKLQEAQAAKQLEVLMNPPPPKPPETRPPSESISFKDLPPEGQVQLAAKAGIQIGPQAAPQPVQPSMPQHQPMPAQHAPVPMPPPQPQPQPQPQSQPAQPQQAAAPADNIPNAPSGQEVG